MGSVGAVGAVGTAGVAGVSGGRCPLCPSDAGVVQGQCRESKIPYQYLNANNIILHFRKNQFVYKWTDFHPKSKAIGFHF